MLSRPGILKCEMLKEFEFAAGIDLLVSSDGISQDRDRKKFEIRVLELGNCSAGTAIFVFTVY